MASAVTKAKSAKSKMTARKLETVVIEKAEGIAWCIFNRPEKRNAMSPQLHLDMNQALDELALVMAVTARRPVAHRLGRLANRVSSGVANDIAQHFTR